jgi:hypothetical protein
MPVPTTREQFKDYCLRQLGHPVIQINIDDDQLEDRVDDALQYYRDYHYDGVEKVYAQHQLTDTDITNKYLTIDPLITGITRIFPLTDAQSTSYMFDLRYQLRLNELWDFTSTSYVNFEMTMQHLRTLELLFVGITPIRFNRHMNKLYIDWAWGTKIVAGEYVIMECYRVLDPDLYASVWNDRWLKKYATQLIKKQWGTNIKKFGQIPLPGGVILNGKEIYDEADEAILQLEEAMLNDYGAPMEFQMN